MSSIECHFEDEVWADVVRGVTTTLPHFEPCGHSRGGCAICESAHNLWTSVRNCLPSAIGSEPPAEAVAAIERAFALEQKVPLLSRIAVAANLLFDSFLEPLPAGLRGGSSRARRMVLESEGTTVEMRVEQETPRTGLISGLIVDQQNEGQRAAPSANVLLVHNENTIIDRTVANSMGEFELAFENNDGLCLYVALLQKTIRVPLPEFSGRPVSPRDV